MSFFIETLYKIICVDYYRLKKKKKNNNIPISITFNNKAKLIENH